MLSPWGRGGHTSALGAPPWRLKVPEPAQGSRLASRGSSGGILDVGTCARLGESPPVPQGASAGGEGGCCCVQHSAGGGSEGHWPAKGPPIPVASMEGALPSSGRHLLRGLGTRPHARSLLCTLRPMLASRVRASRSFRVSEKGRGRARCLWSRQSPGGTGSSSLTCRWHVAPGQRCSPQGHSVRRPVQLDW